MDVVAIATSAIIVAIATSVTYSVWMVDIAISVPTVYGWLL